MKKVFTSVVLTALLAMFGTAYGDDFLAKDSQVARANVLIDPDGTADGSASVGYEVSFGTAVYALDEAALFVGWADDTDSDRTEFGLRIAEHWPIEDTPLVPYAAAGAGYGWADLDGEEDVESILWRLELGSLYSINETWALSGSLEFTWSDEEIFQEDDGVNDKNFQIGLGARYFF